MFIFKKKKINMSMINNNNAKRKNIIHIKKSSHIIKKKTIINEKSVVGDDDSGDDNKYSYDNIEDITSYIKENKNAMYAFVICGVGDFICIDYFLHFKNINFIFVSKSSLLLKTLLMKTEKINNSNTKHFAVYFNFNSLNRPGFKDKNEMFSCIPYLNLLTQIKKINIIDITFFKFVRNTVNYKPNTELMNQKNKFLTTTYCNVKEKFNLPDNIVLICPCTRDNRVKCILCNTSHTEIHNCVATRNFTRTDYYNTKTILKKNKMIGVIVTDIYVNICEDFENLFINLSGKTSIEESIEILKASNAYIGIDSFLSVIASKIFTSDNVTIKCNNKHGYEWKAVYWYPLNPQLNNFKKL